MSLKDSAKCKCATSISSPPSLLLRDTAAAASRHSLRRSGLGQLWGHYLHQGSYRGRRKLQLSCSGLTPPSVNSQLPRIIESIPRKRPAPDFPRFPELSLRQPIEWVQAEATSNKWSWPVLILAVVALAVVAEAILVGKVSVRTAESVS